MPFSFSRHPPPTHDDDDGGGERERESEEMLDAHHLILGIWRLASASDDRCWLLLVLGVGVSGWWHRPHGQLMPIDAVPVRATFSMVLGILLLDPLIPIVGSKHRCRCIRCCISTHVPCVCVILLQYLLLLPSIYPLLPTPRWPRPPNS